jgi:hypothetical protein
VISQENLNFITEKLNNHAFKRYNFSVNKTAEDYLNHYKKEKEEYLHLTGGLEIEKFIN